MTNLQISINVDPSSWKKAFYEKFCERDDDAIYDKIEEWCREGKCGRYRERNQVKQKISVSLSYKQALYLYDLLENNVYISGFKANKKMIKILKELKEVIE